MNKREKAVVDAARQFVLRALASGSYDSQGIGKSTLKEAVYALARTKLELVGYVFKRDDGSYYGKDEYNSDKKGAEVWPPDTKMDELRSLSNERILRRVRRK